MATWRHPASARILHPAASSHLHPRRGIADFICRRPIRPATAPPPIAECVAPSTNLTLLALADSEIDVDATERRIWMHEQSGSNGLPHGVAIPHAGVPGLTEPRIAVGFSEAGIDFNAADGTPARMILLLLTPFHDLLQQAPAPPSSSSTPSTPSATRPWWWRKRCCRCKTARSCWRS